ncbi:fibroblast growth factor 5-like [Petromyzon marinus]|uniref:Fibroblast growth factor n=1 Tax=Petromyzon marinus TaxID=7757 RepID=A0AAJ7X8D3_PETMA|nr:fibroblast growth factor 5-like [Petromyzon marinus]
MTARQVQRTAHSRVYHPDMRFLVVLAVHLRCLPLLQAIPDNPESNSDAEPTAVLEPAGLQQLQQLQQQQHLAGPGTLRSAGREPRHWGKAGARKGSLYCRVGIGYHLQIHADGRVSGTHTATLLSMLEIFALSPGIVVIRGTYSNRFLAMNYKGKIYASAKFNNECRFRETYQENSYNTYSSAAHPIAPAPPASAWYLALNKRGLLRRGNSPRLGPNHVSTHFLPLFSGATDDPARASDAAAVAGDKTFRFVGKKAPASVAVPKQTAARPAPPAVEVQRKAAESAPRYWPKFRFG